MRRCASARGRADGGPLPVLRQRYPSVRARVVHGRDVVAGRADATVVHLRARSPREILSIEAEIERDNKWFLLRQNLVQHPDVAGTSLHVRADVKVSGFMVIPKPDSADTCTVVHLNQVNFKQRFHNVVTRMDEGSVFSFTPCLLGIEQALLRPSASRARAIALRWPTY